MSYTNYQDDPTIQADEAAVEAANQAVVGQTGSTPGAGYADAAAQAVAAEQALQQAEAPYASQIAAQLSAEFGGTISPGSLGLPGVTGTGTSTTAAGTSASTTSTASGTTIDPTQAANFGIIQQYLQQMGITDPSALSWAQGLLTSGASPSQVEVEMYNQPWFQARFPGIFQRQKAGLPPISPSDYISYEDQARQLESAYGLPSGYLDNPTFIGNQIGQDVSMSELQDRVEKGFAVVNTAPPEVQDAFDQMFGASGPAALAAYVMDPTRSVPLLEKQVLAAQNMGAGLEQGFRPSASQAEEMAGMGISYGQAQSGFSNLQGIRPFFIPGVGESETQDINTTGINATFGLDATSQAALARLKAQRQAEFAGGAAPVTTGQGVVGAGTQREF